MYLNQLLLPGKNNIDIFRVIAALLVIYGHAPAFVPNAASHDFVAGLLGFDYSGSLAVKFFFILSGLLVTNSLISRPQLVEFLIKRSARIFPGLIVCVFATTFVVGPFFTTLNPVDYFTHPETWRYFTHNSIIYNLQWFLPGVFTEGLHAINGSLWTLPLEFLCYLFLGAFFAIGLWRNSWLSTTLLLAIVGISFFAPNFLPPVFANNKEANLLAGCFAIGALFATHKNQINITGQGFCALALLTFLLWSSPLKILVFYVFAFYGCLYLSVTPLFLKKLKLAADPSYGIYIYGFVIQQSLAHLFPEKGVIFNQLFGALIAIIVGILSWFFIEKPSIRITKNLLAHQNMLIALRNAGMVYFNKLLNLITVKNVFIFVGLLLVAWLMHFAALYFIFPGYYHPLYFHHSDFYIPAAFAYAPNDTYSYTNLLNWPRPLLMWFLKFMGYFGHAGSVACVVAIVFLNCALTALFFKRVLSLKRDLTFYVFFALYCFVLFTQPYFYTFYSQDIGSQLSYLLLLTGLFVFYLIQDRYLIRAFLVLFCCSVCAFLIKETYIISVSFVVLCWFVFYLKKKLIKALTPGIAVFIAAVIAVIINLRIKSVFVNLDADHGSDYQISFDVVSVLKELSRYGQEAITPILIFALGSIAFVVYKQYKNRLLLIGFFICIGFAILAWLPNALLPFHHYQGYSFNGLYVCFATLFFAVKMVQEKILSNKIVWTIFIVVLISPLSSVKKYKDGRNQWVLAMETVQRNMLMGFRQATGQLLMLDKSSHVTVLVTGISSPFHPFAFPESIRSFPGGDRASYYFVVPPEFPARLGEKVDLVQFISEADKGSVVSDQEWQFDKDGKLVAVLKK